MTDYAKEKLKVLKQLKVKMTKEERNRIKDMQSEIQIDNFARYLITRKPEVIVVKKVWCGETPLRN